jgi:hypothetical protein
MRAIVRRDSLLFMLAVELYLRHHLAPMSDVFGVVLTPAWFATTLPASLLRPVSIPRSMTHRRVGLTPRTGHTSPLVRCPSTKGV